MCMDKHCQQEKVGNIDDGKFMYIYTERGILVVMGEDEEVWAEKCLALKRKCDEYEEMNGILACRTKKVRRMVQRSESEKSLLVKHLKQFGVLSEVPRMDFSKGLYSVPALNNETTLLATAMKIRTELDKELAHTRTITQDVKHIRDSEEPRKSMLGSTHLGGEHGSSGMNPRSYRSPASSHNGVTNTPQHSPRSTSQTSVASGKSLHNNSSSSAVIGSPGTGKIKKATRIKHAPHGLNLPPDKQKPLGRGHSTKKRKTDADPNAPKKPSNAFFWFCQEMRPSLQEQCREEGMSGQHDLTKALAKLWSETKTEDKKHYYHKYTADKARYDREMEEYATNKFLSITHDMDT